MEISIFELTISFTAFNPFPKRYTTLIELEMVTNRDFTINLLKSERGRDTETARVERIKGNCKTESTMRCDVPFCRTFLDFKTDWKGKDGCRTS